MAALITSIVGVIVLVILWFLGLNERFGYMLLYNLFPTTYPSRGDKIDIFINGQYNRKATVTACCYDWIVIYDAIQLPVDYRGNFYAIGVDGDGNKILYVDDIRHKHLVWRAELIRRVCNVPSEYGTLTPFDDNKPIRDILSGIKDADHPDPTEGNTEITVEGVE